MKFLPALLFGFCFPFFCPGQAVIGGRIVKTGTEEPIPGCSVFISGTTKGTVSDSAGHFMLSNFPEGDYDLVISSIGFETNIYSFKSRQLPLQLKVELSIKVKELEAVILEPYLDEDWRKWGKKFDEFFIGMTEYAHDCYILNKEIIKFRFYKKTERLLAFADEPIILENRALGYKIEYQLEYFEIDYKKNTTFFKGYPLFSRMQTENKKLEKIWRENRLKSYSGSVMHFMRALYNDNLLKEGFDVRRILKVKDKKGEIEYVFEDTALSTNKILIKTEDNYKFVRFDETLYIRYLNQPVEDQYKLYDNRARYTIHQESYSKMQHTEEPLLITKKGSYFDAANFLSRGYWSFRERLANMLPWEYEAGD